MQENINPAAPHVFPAFITPPNETDVFLLGAGIFLVVAVFLIGILFLWLHSLPERMAHKSHKLQFEIVAVLCLVSLFTHNNFFWIAALLLAVIDLPDIGTPLRRIADALDGLRGDRLAARQSEPALEPPVAAAEAAVSNPPPIVENDGAQAASPSTKPEA